MKNGVHENWNSENVFFLLFFTSPIFFLSLCRSELCTDVIFLLHKFCQCWVKLLQAIIVTQKKFIFYTLLGTETARSVLWSSLISGHIQFHNYRWLGFIVVVVCFALFVLLECPFFSEHTNGSREWGRESLALWKETSLIGLMFLPYEQGYINNLLETLQVNTVILGYSTSTHIFWEGAQIDIQNLLHFSINSYLVYVKCIHSVPVPL